MSVWTCSEYPIGSHTLKKGDGVARPLSELTTCLYHCFFFFFEGVNTNHKLGEEFPSKRRKHSGKGEGHIIGVEGTMFKIDLGNDKKIVSFVLLMERWHSRDSKAFFFFFSHGNWGDEFSY